MSSDLFSRIKAGAKTKMESLQLKTDDDLTTVQIYTQIDIDRDKMGIQFPCIVLATASLSEQMEEEASDTEVVSIKWPVGVAIMERDSKKDSTLEPQYLRWRRTIIENFRDQRLTGVPEVYRCTFSPQAIFANVPDLELIQSSFILWFHALEGRY